VPPDQRRTRREALDSRARIVAAGADLLGRFPIWNWAALTVPAVAKQAALTERTVYRHFGSELGLRDAVMEHILEQADLTLEGLTLDDFAATARRLLDRASSYPLAHRTPQDPTVVATNQRQRRILLEAVSPETPGWSPADRAIATAMLDAQWASITYERLVLEWGLSRPEAIRGILWVLGLIEAAIRAGDAPP
jgi:AcrR family transcriptional regulator